MGQAEQEKRTLRITDVKPYAFPESLDDLHGPATGSVELPVRILWAPGSKVLSLDEEGSRTCAYQAVLAEGNAKDICHYINKDLLISIWPSLSLPIRVAKGWETRFAELRGNMRASW